MLVDRKVFVPMRDGIRIALTLYLPEGPGPFPAVVESLPYRKDDDCFTRDWHDLFSFATSTVISRVTRFAPLPFTAESLTHFRSAS